MAFSKITNIWDSVKHLLLSQYNDSPNLKKLIEIAVNGFQGIEDGADKLSKVLDLENASGSWLDIVGKIKNISRVNGESDSDYRNRLELEFDVDFAGTERYVHKIVSDITGRNDGVFFEEGNGIYFVYLEGDGVELTMNDLKKGSPAGVLGLPGAALKFVDDDDFVGDSDENLILVVADI